MSLLGPLRALLFMCFSLSLLESLSRSLSRSLSLTRSMCIYVSACVYVRVMFVVSMSMFAYLRGSACLFVCIFVVRMCVKHHELNTCSCRVLFLAEEFGKDSSNGRFILAMTSGTLAVVLAI